MQKSLKNSFTKLFYLLFLFITVCNPCNPSGIYIPGVKAEKPKRIITLAPAATEIIFFTDSQKSLIARTDYCNYPPEVKQIPSIGGFDGKTFSIESILSKKPDFVYLYKGMHDHLIPTLKKYGISIYISDACNVSDVANEILDIGRITNNLEKATQKYTEIHDLQKNSKNLHTLVFWAIYNSPYITIGNDSFINNVIEIAGGTNIFTDIAQAYPVVSEESIIARNPEIIFIPSDSPISINDVLNRSGWKHISACKNKRVYKVDSDIISRPGPRITEGIKLLKEIINE